MALVRRRPDGHVEPGPAVPEAPHDRAPEGPHRDRDRNRGDLAPVAAPPRDPPHPAGRTGLPETNSMSAERRCPREDRLSAGGNAGPTGGAEDDDVGRGWPQRRMSTQ